MPTSISDTIEDIVVPYKYSITSYKTSLQDTKFLIFQNKDMLAFASPSGLEILRESEWWAADGTFKVSLFLLFFTKPPAFFKTKNI